MKNSLILIALFIAVYINTQQQSQIAFDVKTNSRVIFLNKQMVFTITIKNTSSTPIKNAFVSCSYPKQLEYISSNLKTEIYESLNKVSKFSRFHRFKKVRKSIVYETKWNTKWQVDIAPNTTRKIIVNVRGVAGTPRCESDFRLSIGSVKKHVAVATRIHGAPSYHLSTYDTDDPCYLGTNTTYVVTCRNEGTSTATNMMVINDLPEEMGFISAEVIAPRNQQAKYVYDAKEHSVYFDGVPIVEPGEKVTYKITCRALTKGSAKNTAHAMCDQANVQLIDEEGTSIFE